MMTTKNDRAVVELPNDLWDKVVTALGIAERENVRVGREMGPDYKEATDALMYEAGEFAAARVLILTQVSLAKGGRT